MGNKGSNTTTTQSMPDPAAMMAYYNLLGRAGAVSQTPYAPYTGEEVAPINAQQTAGIGAINANAGFAQPFALSGLSNIEQASGAVSPEDIARYQDPFTNQVINATQADFDTQNARANSIVTGNAAAQGALGGDRVGVAQALTQESQNRTQAPIIAGLRSAGFQNAEAMANAQKARQLAGGAGEVTAATGAQTAGLQGAGAMVGAGTLQQQTQQAADTQARMDYYQSQGYPFATAQWLAGIDTAVGSQLGGNSKTTGPAPNPWAQVAGLGLAAVGAFAKDGGRIRGFASGGLANPWGEAGQGWVPTIGLTGGAGPPKPPSLPKETNPFTKDSAKGLASLGKKATDWWNDPMTASAPAEGVGFTSDQLGGFGESALSGGLGWRMGGGVKGYEFGGVPTSVGVGSFLDDDTPNDVVARRFPKELTARFISPINGQLRALGERRLQEAPGELHDPNLSSPRVVQTERILPDEAPAPVAREDVIPQAKTALRGVVKDDEGDLSPDVSSYAPRAIVAPRGVSAQQSDFPAPAQEVGEGSVFSGLGNIFGKLSPEAKQGMISMGLGMMANRVGGPGSFLASVGEGGQQGMQTYASAKAATALEALQARKEAFEREKFNRPYQEMTQHEKALNAREKDRENAALERAGYRRGTNGALEHIPGGPADPKTIETLTKAKRSSALSDNALEIAARRIVGGDLTALTNVGRGAQGDEKLSQISNRAAEILVEQGMNPVEAAAHISKQVQEFKAHGMRLNAAARTGGTREENLDLILRATEAAIPAAIEASKNVYRTGWVPLNQIIQGGQIIANNPELREWGMANLQLAEHWARAMNPTGVMRESDRDLALKFLATTDSPQTYERAVKQLQKQIQREKDAVSKKSSTTGPLTPGGAAPSEASAPKVGDRKQFKQGWGVWDGSKYVQEKP